MTSTTPVWATEGAWQVSHATLRLTERFLSLRRSFPSRVICWYRLVGGVEPTWATVAAKTESSSALMRRTSGSLLMTAATSTCGEQSAASSVGAAGVGLAFEPIVAKAPARIIANGGKANLAHLAGKWPCMIHPSVVSRSCKSLQWLCHPGSRLLRTADELLDSRSGLR